MRKVTLKILNLLLIFTSTSMFFAKPKKSPRKASPVKGKAQVVTMKKIVHDLSPKAGESDQDKADKANQIISLLFRFIIQNRIDYVKNNILANGKENSKPLSKVVEISIPDLSINDYLGKQIKITNISNRLSFFLGKTFNAFLEGPGAEGTQAQKAFSNINELEGLLSNDTQAVSQGGGVFLQLFYFALQLALIENISQTFSAEVNKSMPESSRTLDANKILNAPNVTLNTIISLLNLFSQEITRGLYVSQNPIIAEIDKKINSKLQIYEVINLGKLPANIKANNGQLPADVEEAMINYLKETQSTLITQQRENRRTDSEIKLNIYDLFGQVNQSQDLSFNIKGTGKVTKKITFSGKNIKINPINLTQDKKDATILNNSYNNYVSKRNTVKFHDKEGKPLHFFMFVNAQNELCIAPVYNAYFLNNEGIKVTEENIQNRKMLDIYEIITSRNQEIVNKDMLNNDYDMTIKVTDNEKKEEISYKIKFVQVVEIMNNILSKGREQ